MHAFDKPNASTVSSQTPVSRKDVFLDGIIKRAIFSFIDLMDRLYPILMREEDIPYKAVRNTSGSLELASYARKFKLRLCHIPQVCFKSIETGTRFCTELL